MPENFEMQIDYTVRSCCLNYIFFIFMCVKLIGRIEINISAMKKFEYKSFTFAYMENDSIAGSDIKVLNKLGAQGWEVIAIAPVKQWKQVGHPENLVAILKREIEK